MSFLKWAGIHANHCTLTALIFAALTLPLDQIAEAEATGGQHTRPDAHAPGHDAHAHHRLMAASPGRYRRSVHFYRIPDVTLIDMGGSRMSLAAALEGDSPTVLNFIFTSCTSICPVLSATFSQFQSRLDPDRDKVRMISISIDPEYDSTEKLRAYARRYNAGPQWRFLTGRVSDIVAVQKAFDAYRGNKMGHEPFTFLRASADAPWVRLDGFASGADLIAEYRRVVSK